MAYTYATQARVCDHKFIDSDHCLKCGERYEAMHAAYLAELRFYLGLDREAWLSAGPQGAD